jgi:enoyl-CoA hydratase/carnithine racemase
MIKHNHSPLSFALTFELFKRNSQNAISYKEALYEEFKWASAFWKSREFKEGVRARLIDKDNKPNWLHKSVE